MTKRRRAPEPEAQGRVECLLVHSDRRVQKSWVLEANVKAGAIQIETPGAPYDFGAEEYRRIGETTRGMPVFAQVGWVLKYSDRRWERPWRIPELDKQDAVRYMQHFREEVETVSAKEMPGCIPIDSVAKDDPHPSDTTRRVGYLAILYAVPRPM